MTSRALGQVRRTAGAVRRRIFPSPEVAAWKRACAAAERTPRRTAGRIAMMEYNLEYSDLRTFCPQWHDIFVRRSLAFEPRSPRPRVLDCGANIGLASLFFKRCCPGARITAYEADPALFSLLVRNLGANGAADVETRHAAVWTSDRPVTFRCDGADSGMLDDLPAAIDGYPVRVPAVRLRDVLAAETIDLLKLDIEGAEDTVLEDCEPHLDRVSAIVMDLHELDPARRQSPRVLDLLTRCGFLYAIDDLTALPWRPPVAPPGSPFAGCALVWSATVRAWRP